MGRPRGYPYPNLRERRIAAGYVRPENLAVEVPAPASTVSLWESNNRIGSKMQFDRVCELLGPPGEVVGMR